MPIQLKLTNGTILPKVIKDQTVDSSQASITFVGRGWVSYSDFSNQNLLQMLENFSSPAYPNNPLLGQIWYDSNRQGIRVQVGKGGPDADPQGWTSPLTTLDYVNQSITAAVQSILNENYITAQEPLIFADPTSDIIVPATGTIANPPALILKNVNIGWMAGDAQGDPANPPASSSGTTYTNIVVNAKGLVVAARPINAKDLNALQGTTVLFFAGDVSGNGVVANPINLSLANVNSNTGTFNTVSVNSKGLVIGASNTSYLTANQNITFSGDASGSGSTAVTLTLKAVNSNIGTYSVLTVNAKGLVTAARQLNVSDVVNALGYTPYNSTNPNGYINASNFALDGNSPGWMELPNGFIIQWGNVGFSGVATSLGSTTTAIAYFARSFPNVCLSCTANGLDGPNNGLPEGSEMNIGVQSLTTTYAAFLVSRASGTNASGNEYGNVTWMAIGY